MCENSLSQHKISEVTELKKRDILQTPDKLRCLNYQHSSIIQWIVKFLKSQTKFLKWMFILAKLKGNNTLTPEPLQTSLNSFCSILLKS